MLSADSNRQNALARILARGASAALASQILGAAILFGAQIVMARLIGSVSFGRYIWTLSTITVLAFAGKLGYDLAATRFLAQYEASKDWARMRGFLRHSLTSVSGLSAIMAILAALFGFIIRNRWDAETLRAWWIACLLLPVLALQLYHVAALRGFKKILMSTLPWEVTRPALTLGFIVALPVWFACSISNAEWAMWSNLLATTLGLSLQCWFLRRSTPPEAHLAAPTYEHSLWRQTAVAMALISGFNIIYRNADIIMIGIFMDREQSGFYAAASRIAMPITFGLGAVNAIIAPMASALHTEGRRDDLQRIVTWSAWANFCFTLPAAIIIVLTGNFLLGLFGGAFTVSYGALCILAGSQAAAAFAGSVGFLMIMTGHERAAAKAMGSSAILNIILNAILIPRWGLTGAAAATAISIVSWKVMLTAMVHQRLRINSTILSKPARKTAS
ncbi:polysaccharide biosynthesis C-terminal domain-containing protein [Candidatus Sumerlaeota bacterium]|nr:polysaccharide biosynthesis C-terminal domain-containing protein [Candidatus Sumerlaeota bacterium]